MRQVLCALLVVMLTPLSALAHEKGVIRLSSQTIAVGAQLTIAGEKLPKNSALRLELRGTLETFPLGEIRTDAAGAFTTQLGLPAEARAGSYTVVAVAQDGDAVARVELAVVAVAAPGETGAHAAMGHTPEEMRMPHATDDLMDVPVAKTPVEWAVIVALIASSLIAAAVLLRHPGRP